jgi:osmotically-inducible protein OsmY
LTESGLPIGAGAVARVRQALVRSGYAALKQLQCALDAETLVLTGRVPSFYLKQLAQEIARRSSGLEQVTNDVKVVDDQ